ncbi:hypothetical protein L1765_00905 [Microaerobacter geothermalis]|uniref:hypothetical protein n=1 Tax=Microaerobacter geothermalis TaxID=674972 RepID=UPI001F2D1EA3|nr:hypothetical protein [Microaerobacter geothermalis]MCF6092551.1 hypothetical protein [Microaerobacter geothermalis]
MSDLTRIAFLRTLKEELIEKLRDPSTTYSQMVEINKQLGKLNHEIQHMKMMLYREKRK